MRNARFSFPQWVALAAWAGVVLLNGHSLKAQESPVRAWLRSTLPAWNEATHREADAAVSGTFTLQGVTGTVPHLANGGWDWTWGGPNHDPEFAWFLNRQHHIPALFVAWRETKDERYRKALNDQLRDWLHQNPKPGHYSFSSSWRALEVARRVEEAWLPVMFAPEADVALDADVHAGMLASIPDHATALRDEHSFSGNHLITEMTGLATIALAYPEMNDAPSWLDYALKQSNEEIAREIYPDGAEKELSNLYQQVVLLELQKLADLLTIAGHDKDAAVLHPVLENAWNYYAHTLSPLGHGPLNNDSSVQDDAALVKKMAGVYHRPDWLYIATQGQEGTAPTGTPSDYFPYAGLAVMRSGWDAKAQWAYFDMGPRGTDHQHADHLQLSIGGGGREFLVDDGRYNYQPGIWRDYFTGPQGHNVVLLDGKGTLPPPDEATESGNVFHPDFPSTQIFSATAAFPPNSILGQGPAYHTRKVEFAGGNYWQVEDSMLCAGLHKLEVLWHFNPDCIVKCDDTHGRIYTDDPGRANLVILQDQVGIAFKMELIRGREAPSPQGWYSPSFNQKVPATCVSCTTILDHPVTVHWLIWIVPPGHDPSKEQPGERQ